MLSLSTLFDVRKDIRWNVVFKESMNLCTIWHCRRERFHWSKLLLIHFRSANDFHCIEFEKEVSHRPDCKAGTSFQWRKGHCWSQSSRLYQRCAARVTHTGALFYPEWIGKASLTIFLGKQGFDLPQDSCATCRALMTRRWGVPEVNELVSRINGCFESDVWEYIQHTSFLSSLVAVRSWWVTKGRGE